MGSLIVRLHLGDLSLKYFLPFVLRSSYTLMIKSIKRYTKRLRQSYQSVDVHPPYIPCAIFYIFHIIHMRWVLRINNHS